MFKKIVILLSMFIVLSIGTVAFADSSMIKVNHEVGTVSIQYKATDYSDLKVLVQKGTERYVYNLFSAHDVLPLQMGSGEYTIGIYIRTEGNKFRLLTSQKVNVEIDLMKVYTASVQNMNWSKESEAIKYAAKLTQKAKTDREKFNLVYSYMIKNIVYDYQKAASMGTRYIPVIDNTYKDEKGICYDYSSLMASMLRSAGIPTKLVEGKSTFTSVYHAWNEVYLDGKWITVDSTIDAQLVMRNIPYSIEKSLKDYTVAKSF
jgi:hypothetical protein